MGILQKVPDAGTIVKSAVEGIFGPFMNRLEEMLTSGEERGEIRTEILALQRAVTEAMLSTADSLVGASRDVIVAEAQSESWLPRNIRPIAMAWMMALITWLVAVAPFNPDLAARTVYAIQGIPTPLWVLFTTAITGYISSRGLEKLFGAAGDTFNRERISTEKMTKLIQRLRKAGVEPDDISDILKGGAS